MSNWIQPKHSPYKLTNDIRVWPSYHRGRGTGVVVEHPNIPT